MVPERRAIITGASSGIGLALARELVSRGWSVALLARRTDLLTEAVSAISASAKRAAAGGLSRAVAVTCDVTDAAGVAAAVRRAEEELRGPFDLAIANAGVGVPTHATRLEASAAEQVMRVNVLGMMNLFAAVVPTMVERRNGRFAGVASLAGLRGLPTASVYSASKAAMQAFLEASRVELREYGVGVTIINPGFITTAMTERHRFKMPFLMSADRAARIIVDGLEKGSRRIEFPWVMSAATRLLRHVPDPLFDRMMTRAARFNAEKDERR